jgi:outer membrane protein assembly factor BamB
MKVSKAWTRGGLVVLGVLVLALVLVLLRSRSGGGAESGLAPANGAQPGSASSPARGGSARPAQADSGAAEAGATSKRPEVIAQVGWGSGPEQLGRHHSGEGNPEAPMSLAVTPRGDVMVLDQVNGRIVRYGPDGKVLGSVPVTQQTPQDIAVAKDGTLAVLDRLRDKTVALIDPETNQLKGELPLTGKNLPEPGLVTGTFVLDDSVYVEREHGALVRIGNVSGQADPAQPELPGRPSRDGKFYVAAHISNRAEGRLVIYFLDRETYAQRMARELSLQFPLLYLTLLDTDRAGIVYVAVVGELPTGQASPASAPGMRLYCLEPVQGKVIGQADLIYSPMPEETFRDLVVLDEGGIIYQVRTEAGVTLRRADCR